MKDVEFFFDLASTYSYLAATQIEALAARHGARVLWKPMVLGAVFKATGNTMPAAVAAKAQYMLRDMSRWAARYGVGFTMNSRFPMNTINAMRLILVADEAGKAAEVARAAFRRAWVEDRDLTAPEELAAIAAECGLDASAVARIGEPAIKDKLRANTDDAIRRGAFGAPAIFVGDELFWGNDRLDFVESALAG